MRLLIRIGGTLLGVGAAAVALLMPVQVLIERGSISSIGVWFFSLVVSGVFASVSYICFRYFATYPRRVGQRYEADRVFKSIGVASASALLAAVLSQIVLLVVAAIRIRRLPESLRESVQIGWSPIDWEIVRDSPYFLFPVLALFSTAFYWQYRQTGRAIHR